MELLCQARITSHHTSYVPYHLAGTTPRCFRALRSPSLNTSPTSDVARSRTDGRRRRGNGRGDPSRKCALGQKVIFTNSYTPQSPAPLFLVPLPHYYLDYTTAGLTPHTRLTKLAPIGSDALYRAGTTTHNKHHRHSGS